MIDWYYVYSQRYLPFHFYLEDNIPKPLFRAQGIFVDQSVFDEHLYKHKGEHFFSRITVKVETLLRLLTERKSQANASPFFFTDCDILVTRLAETYLTPYLVRTDVDMIFQQEYSDDSVVNPGVMLLWPTDRTIDFWKCVLNDMKRNITMEMTAINKQLQEKQVKWDTFDTGCVCSNITCDLNKASTPCIYHLLCNCISREIDIGDKMYLMTVFGVQMEDYIKKTKEMYGQIFM